LPNIRYSKAGLEYIKMMENRKKHRLIFPILLLFLLFGANFVFALPSFALEINYPDIPGAIPPQDFLNTAAPEETPSLYVKYLFNLAIWVVGIIAFGALIYGGIKYLTSTGKAEAMASAREQISAVFFGILILLSSFFILKILNPQFIVLELPGLEPIPEPIEIGNPPPTEELRTSINTEIPFGTIIQKGVFEGVKPFWEEEKRIPRIKNNAGETNKIADKLKKQNEDLKKYTDKCKCKDNTVPDPRCNWEKPHLTPYNCPPSHCTCDPCTSGGLFDFFSSPRDQIQKTESKNLEEINNLIAEQIKTEEEVRLINEQLEKLERAEKFMLDCYDWLDSLAGMLVTKESFTVKGYIFRNIKFWENILIEGDWATFYCPVSGAILGETEYIDISSDIAAEIEDIGPIEEVGEEISPACTTEIPVGEIIDRTLRTGNLLKEKMEQLIELDKEMVNAVDKMHQLVSQCSSRNCHPYCFCYCCEPCPPNPCCGWCCTEIGCYGQPCPSGKIQSQLKEIQRIQEEIKDVIEGEKGIIPIIDKVIPKILEDLDEKVRKEMRFCVSDIAPEELESSDLIIVLLTCGGSERAVGPEAPAGKIIQKCCLKEEPFQNCLEKCYLKEGYKKYKECLYGCIETKPEDIIKCRHKLNFYCCEFSTYEE